MKNVKENLVLYYNSYLLALVSTVYGWQLVAHPTILQTYEVYQKLRDVFDHRLIGLFFMALGVLYVVATVLDWRKVRRLTLPIFSFIWTFFGIGFAISEPPNTVWALTIAMALLSFGISLRGDFKDG